MANKSKPMRPTKSAPRPLRPALRDPEPEESVEVLDEEEEMDEDDEQDDDDDADDADDDRDGDGDDADGDADEEEYTAASYMAGQRIPLPSGKYIRVKPVSLISMIDQDKLPPHLLAAARKQVYGKDDRIAKMHANDLTRRGQREGTDGELIEWFCCKVVTSFKCVLKPQAQCNTHANEVSVYHMWESDKIAIMEYAMKGQSALKPFRRQRGIR